MVLASQSQLSSFIGRYYWQKGDKRGLADWDAIKRIRDSFPNIPIIGNGNIGSGFAVCQLKSFRRVLRLREDDTANWS
jgi:hypothetical protein